MMRRARLASACMPFVFVASCTAPPGPPPMVDLSARDCASAPDLASARPLALDAGKALTIDLDAASACWQASEDRRSAYVVFQLPDAATPYLVGVTSAPQGQTLFSPRLILLDGQGSVARELRRDAFLFHGASLYASIRSHAGERYLVVASDPGSVGQRVSQITGNVQAAMIAAGGAFFAVHTGGEASNVFTYAHNGAVTVSAEKLP